MVTKTPKKKLKQGMLGNVMRQFHNAADIITLNLNIRKILEVTNNELVVHFPAKYIKVDIRTAAFIIAIERLEEAYVQRGIFP